MNKQRALEFTKDRIYTISKATYETENERKIAQETLEYLVFIEKMLEE